MIRKISISDVEAALKAAEGSNTTVNVPVTVVFFFSPFLIPTCFLKFILHISSILATASK